MEIEIRQAVPADLSRVLELMAKFAEHVSLANYLTATEDRLSKAVFGEGAFVEMLVVSEKHQLVGYAIYYPHFSSFRAERGFYLEDIFVAEHSRGRGIGLKMLKYIARQAAERSFNRLDFQVLSTNATALKFYEDLGADVNKDEFRMKFSGSAFDRLAT
jgi:GNAT superfamily N-acetyltransferase